MKYKSKIMIILLFFSIIIPSVQANVFDDVKNINQGIQEANLKLDELQASIDELNNKTQEVSENMLILEETNQGIQEMSDQLDELSNTLSDALEITDKFDSFVEDIKSLILVGLGVIILAILTLIGSTIVIVKRKK